MQFRTHGDHLLSRHEPMFLVSDSYLNFFVVVEKLRWTWTWHESSIYFAKCGWNSVSGSMNHSQLFLFRHRQWSVNSINSDGREYQKKNRISNNDVNSTIKSMRPFAKVFLINLHATNISNGIEITHQISRVKKKISWTKKEYTQWEFSQPQFEIDLSCSSQN